MAAAGAGAGTPADLEDFLVGSVGSLVTLGMAGRRGVEGREERERMEVECERRKGERESMGLLSAVLPCVSRENIHFDEPVDIRIH